MFEDRLVKGEVANEGHVGEVGVVKDGFAIRGLGGNSEELLKLVLGEVRDVLGGEAVEVIVGNCGWFRLLEGCTCLSASLGVCLQDRFGEGEGDGRYMSGMSLVTVLADPSRPAPHEKQYTGDYSELSPVTPTNSPGYTPEPRKSNVNPTATADTNNQPNTTTTHITHRYPPVGARHDC